MYLAQRNLAYTMAERPLTRSQKDNFCERPIAKVK